LQTVVQTPAFLNDARRLGLSEAERFAMVTWLASNPAAGDVIEGAGGARKIRFAGKGEGKSGGYRVITFYTGTGYSRFPAEPVREEREDRSDARGTSYFESHPGGGG
jgi:hypothetical protein